MTEPSPAAPASWPGPGAPPEYGPGGPAPPPGPGVTPPFAAPPTEGRSRRLWLGLGAAGLAVLLCCGGGGAAVVGLLVTSTQALNEQARTVTANYLDAVSEERYDDAYELLCDRLQGEESPASFARRVGAEPEIVGYRLGELNLVRRIELPADVRYADSSEESLVFVLEQDTSTGALEVCGTD